MAKQMDYNKWKLHQFTNFTAAGDDFLQFEKEMRSDLRKQLKAHDITLKKFIKGHYYFSAIAEKDGELAYICVHDVRENPSMDVSWFRNVLYRTMAHEKDWTGGQNWYAPWDRIGGEVAKLFERGR